jgi:hypothetical protein
MALSTAATPPGAATSLSVLPAALAEGLDEDRSLKEDRPRRMDFERDLMVSTTERERSRDLEGERVETRPRDLSLPVVNELSEDRPDSPLR